LSVRTYQRGLHLASEAAVPSERYGHLESGSRVRCGKCERDRRGWPPRLQASENNDRPQLPSKHLVSMLPVTPNHRLSLPLRKTAFVSPNPSLVHAGIVFVLWIEFSDDPRCVPFACFPRFPVSSLEIYKMRGDLMTRDDEGKKETGEIDFQRVQGSKSFRLTPT